jgi:hypothetical protein
MINKELLMRYRALHQQIDGMGKDLLKLMRHPDSTQEQILRGRDAYFHSYAMWVEARMILQEKHPPHRRFLQPELPWNKPEDL